MADDANFNASPDVLGSNAQGMLKSTIERIERLEEDKAAIMADLKEVYLEAKGNGFDVKIIRKVVRLRKQDRAKRQEEEALTDLYLSALGELPLFEGRAREGGGLATVTLHMESGESVTATPDQLAVAERIKRGFAVDDALYDQAVAIVRRDDKGSSSYLQRRLQLGYNHAAALVERMEREGVVGPPNHAGKRLVLRPGAEA